ncbi:DinB family protein [Wenjunlia tyrosinilytica]|jgi:uncharacterized damage-inducible protein DinB|uniref:DinB family protein n=1 Tax=Wenjunlia tyrosinilytica TaxID=1544741 RepID=A0A917ZV39_9ACTN|nr:DinB family protein [Wenjunlia tyrosinilytica]GGO97015.1 hypothetical protein GCM10012280_57830 [Wenjunlia tyrosinilytica]
MPTLVGAEADERDALLQFLSAQRESLRRAVHGLTEEQAASRPSASALSLSGLIKHAALVERGWTDLMTGRAQEESRNWETEFSMVEGETLAHWLREYEAVALYTEKAVADLPDLEATVALPEAPWFPPGSRRSARWILLHLVEEAARHAGHADIVRESIDGATSYQLIAATAQE